jgi:hypothetical protein
VAAVLVVEQVWVASAAPLLRQAKETQAARLLGTFMAQVVEVGLEPQVQVVQVLPQVWRVALV